jgi:predicted lipoprotein with Yx(FWY)xxD motif
MKRVAIGAAAGLVLLSMGTAQAQMALTGAKGMTLYSFDKDKGGSPSCYEQCAMKWPPFVDAAAKPGKGWTMVARTDGGKQWAYDGKPAYYFAGDKKPGDMAGDGMGGVWHVLHP